MSRVYDVAVIGGGINGCGIARDAQGRGLDTVLFEMDDLASGTSSASTKLIHGGLRYLEFYEFKLVRESLREREVLLAMAPHIIWPLRFVLPHHSGLRPWPVIRLGLFLYDHLGGRQLLPPTRSVDLRDDAAGVGLKPQFRRAFEYSDCWVEDARLVVLNARDAADRGAEIRTRTKCVAARREDGLWRLSLEERRGGGRDEVTARALVNAAGPWVKEVVGIVAGSNIPVPTRLVKGSHIVVDRVFRQDNAFIFQNGDGRVCFAIPYEQDFTLIGTTDEDFEGDPAEAVITEEETDYLLASVNEYLERPIGRDTIRWRYTGVRPLQDDGSSKAQEASRDYLVTLEGPTGGAPLISVFGGKITTFRHLAEEVLGRLGSTFPQAREPWTRGVHLPGGNIPVTEFDEWQRGVGQRYPFLDAHLVRRLCRAYGTRVDELLTGVAAASDLGRDFGAGLSEREVDYLMETEWAETAADILWRRSKLGLRLDRTRHAAVEDHLRSKRGDDRKTAGVR